MQEFLDFDKKALMERHGMDIWKAIYDGTALVDPERYLSRFGLIVYADLKKYRYYYWFFFPAINYPKDTCFAYRANPNSSGSKSDPLSSQPIRDILDEKALHALELELDKPASGRGFQRGYFILKHFKISPDGQSRIAAFPLSQYNEAKQSEANQYDCDLYFAFSDPSANPQHPGWVLRNFLCLIAIQFQLETVRIIRLRRGQTSARSKSALDRSMVIHVRLNLDSNYAVKSEIPVCPSITGWEKDESQQLAPKRVDLSSLLDPKKLAEDAVSLNLRLMKWRLLPRLDLDRISGTRCLLLGCGTLGCHISRGLLAWGVKNISLVDNSMVSYSNPVRQTLFVFDDSAKTGVYKADAAAASLKKIQPSVNAKAYILSVPMPGHHITLKEQEQTEKDVKLLEKLIDEHDAIFLLTDTRESRWLPTVIAIAKQKLVINAAIGFDTFLLQRYGIRNYSTITPVSTSHGPEHQPSTIDRELPFKSRSDSFLLESNKLGCYFCNDIVAPGDSTQDRTLDQQCTVSRPGVAMMVSAMAVELLVSIVSSSAGAMTPAPIDAHEDSFIDEESYGSELGIVPHTVRGNVSRYHVYMPTSPCFVKCSACSQAVIEAYNSSGFEFLWRVFSDPSYLEEIAGLKDLQNVDDNVWALDSDEDADEVDFAASTTQSDSKLL